MPYFQNGKSYGLKIYCDFVEIMVLQLAATIACGYRASLHRGNADLLHKNAHRTPFKTVGVMDLNFIVTLLN